MFEPSATRTGAETDAPGSPRARERGCTCSVLANAAYRTGQVASPLVEPACPLHAAAPVPDESARHP